MAGTYPDVPSRRIAYDEDGSYLAGGVGSQGAAWDRDSTAIENNPSTITELPRNSAYYIEVNDEDDVIARASGTSGSKYTAILFAVPMDLDAVFIRYTNTGAGNAVNVDTSINATNWTDGDYVTQIPNFTDPAAVDDGYRLAPNPGWEPLAVNAVRGVKISITHGGGTDRMYAKHFYGTPTAGVNPDRVVIIDDTTGLEYTGPLDYGDIPRGTSRDRTLRIKNISDTGSGLSADTITITREALYSPDGAFPTETWYTLSDDSVTFTASLVFNIVLPPGNSSPPFILRQEIPDAVIAPQLYASRLQVNVGTWF